MGSWNRPGTADITTIIIMAGIATVIIIGIITIITAGYGDTDVLTAGAGAVQASAGAYGATGADRRLRALNVGLTSARSESTLAASAATPGPHFCCWAVADCQSAQSMPL